MQPFVINRFSDFQKTCDPRLQKLIIRKEQLVPTGTLLDLRNEWTFLAPKVKLTEEPVPYSLGNDWKV